MVTALQVNQGVVIVQQMAALQALADAATAAIAANRQLAGSIKLRAIMGAAPFEDVTIPEFSPADSATILHAIIDVVNANIAALQTQLDAL